MTAKTSARRHVPDHLIRAACSAKAEESFPRVLRVMYNLWKQESSSSTTLMLPDGSSIPTPTIERCARHKHMEFELPEPIEDDNNSPGIFVTSPSAIVIEGGKNNNIDDEGTDARLLLGGGGDAAAACCCSCCCC